ncbi:MAG TPA: diguanylate cyclase [Acidimicrobiales bacterium]|nr:diguanylate cyclase [Acidimicrobiales bacterium]
MNVLAADDDLVSRMMLQAAVEGLGHDCVVAEDGDQAWELFSESSPQVVITDRMMPGMDGLELCRRIRAHPGAYTYIVLATSLAERGEILRGMQAGADDYLTKPLDPFDLEVRLVAAERVTSLHGELDRYREELARLACTDPLTQLRNRLSLHDDLQALHARSRRYGRNYCLAMCDVDLFKAYNDTVGHQGGDDVLRAMGATLAAHARQGDGVYRYGGEEFLVILPEQAPEAAAVAGERLRWAVEELQIPHPRAPGGVVTLSVGIAAFDPAHEVTAEELLTEADLALYRAKEAGRNRVVVAGGHTKS